MQRFYIKQITANGLGKRTSTVTFADGVNIVHGPSNSGKSYVINCINFMFGGEIPFTRDATGYDKISITFQSTDGGVILAERKIVDGKNGDTGASSVYVSSSIDSVRTGDYSISKYEYSDLLLWMIGIGERHSIISSQDYKPQALTNRTFLHLHYIDEDNIFRKGTVLDLPKMSKITACLTSLKFLIDGDDLRHIIPTESKIERELRIEKNRAVVLYINQTIQNLASRRLELEQELTMHEDIDLDREIDDIVTEIAQLEHQISEATSKSKLLLEQVYVDSSKLEEAILLREQYKALKTQYTSDIKRLQFIANGQKAYDAHRVSNCPFCDSVVSNDSCFDNDYILASKTELERITIQLNDLAQAEHDINDIIVLLETKIQAVTNERNEVAMLINKQLKPKATILKDMLQSHKYTIRLRQEMKSLETMATQFSSDAFEHNTEDDTEKNKFNARDCIASEIWNELSKEFEQTVKGCGYPNVISAAISKDTADVVVNGKFKKNEGKGYRAFLNTVLSFSVLKYLEKHGHYSPSILILDSPILSLKEKILASEHASKNMKESLFSYIIDNCGENQIIIAENEIPTQDIVDYSNANMIAFTLDDDYGRYGFLLDVKDNS